MVKRVIVGAHYGLGGWLAQRVTALVMAAYTLLFVGLVFARGRLDYVSWKALFSPGWMRLATLLFCASVLLHAWVGMRDIWMDYVKHSGIRLALEVLTILLLAGCGGWALQILGKL